MFVKVILVLIIRLTFVKANDMLVEGDRSFSELDKVEVLEGESAKLTCTSGMATRFCMFSGPNKTEMYNVDLETMGLFNMNDVEMDTSDNVCGLAITNVTQNHKGKWKCQVHVANLPNTQPGGNWFANGSKKVERVLLLQILPATSAVVMTWEDSTTRLNISTNPPSKIKGEMLNITLEKNTQKRASLGKERRAEVSLGCPLDGLGYEGVVNWTYKKYEYQMSSSERFLASVNDEDNSAIVTCNVSSKRFSETQMRNADNIATVVFNVMYRPVVLNISRMFIRERSYIAVHVVYRANPGGEIMWTQNIGQEDIEFRNSSAKHIFSSTSGLINKDVYKAVVKIPVSEVEDDNGTAIVDIIVENRVGSTKQEIQLEDLTIVNEEKLFSEVHQDLVVSGNHGLYVGVAVFVAIIGGICVGFFVAFKKRMFFFKNFGTKDPLECCLQEAKSIHRGPGDESSIEDGASSVDDSWSKEEANSSSNLEKI